MRIKLNEAKISDDVNEIGPLIAQIKATYDTLYHKVRLLNQILKNNNHPHQALISPYVSAELPELWESLNFDLQEIIDYYKEDEEEDFEESLNENYSDDNLNDKQAYSIKEVQSKLKTLTKNWTLDSINIETEYILEKLYANQILSQHYKTVICSEPENLCNTRNKWFIRAYDLKGEYKK